MIKNKWISLVIISFPIFIFFIFLYIYILLSTDIVEVIVHKNDQMHTTNNQLIEDIDNFWINFDEVDNISDDKSYENDAKSIEKNDHRSFFKEEKEEKEEKEGNMITILHSGIEKSHATVESPVSDMYLFFGDKIYSVIPEDFSVLTKSFYALITHDVYDHKKNKLIIPKGSTASFKIHHVDYAAQDAYVCLEKVFTTDSLVYTFPYCLESFGKVNNTSISIKSRVSTGKNMIILALNSFRDILNYTLIDAIKVPKEPSLSPPPLKAPHHIDSINIRSLIDLNHSVDISFLPFTTRSNAEKALEKLRDKIREEIKDAHILINNQIADHNKKNKEIYAQYQEDKYTHDLYMQEKASYALHKKLYDRKMGLLKNISSYINNDLFSSLLLKHDDGYARPLSYLVKGTVIISFIRDTINF